VTYCGGRLSVLDKTGLTFSAVVGAEPLDGQGYAAATYGGMIIIAGGRVQGQPVAAVRCIDPKLPYWSDLTPLSLARNGACAAVVGDCLFVCGGRSDNGVEARVDKCDLHTQLVTQAAPLPSARYYARAVVQDGQLYVIGGADDNDGVVDQILRYDAIGDTWTVVGALSHGHSFSGVAVDGDGGIFVVGGYVAGGCSAVVERFDARSLQLSVLPPLPQGRSNPAVLVEAGVLHVFGGGGPTGLTASRFSLSLAPGAAPAAWFETTDALPEPAAFEGMLTGV
jgi:hypothetical protein